MNLKEIKERHKLCHGDLGWVPRELCHDCWLITEVERLEARVKVLEAWAEADIH